MCISVLISIGAMIVMVSLYLEQYVVWWRNGGSYIECCVMYVCLYNNFRRCLNLGIIKNRDSLKPYMTLVISMLIINFQDK